MGNTTKGREGLACSSKGGGGSYYGYNLKHNPKPT